MPDVTCFSCGTHTCVRFRRGVRLVEIACPQCGETALHRPNKGGANPNAGRTYETCSRCGRRGLHLAHPEYEWQPKYEPSASSYPPGSPACPSHEPVPAQGRTDYLDVEDRAVGNLGARQGWADDTETARLTASAPPLGDCPVCSPLGEWWNRGFQYQALRFDAGLALLAICESCGHTILRAAFTDAEKRPGPVSDDVPEDVAVAVGITG